MFVKTLFVANMFVNLSVSPRRRHGQDLQQVLDAVESWAPLARTYRTTRR
ncbi:hypothetical protein ACH4S8_34210 [Streptomyces sp. NPDC021080]